jgi:hypothetical protein
MKNNIILLFVLFVVGCKKDIPLPQQVQTFDFQQVGTIKNVDVKYETTYFKNVISTNNNFSAVSNISILDYTGTDTIRIVNDTSNISSCFLYKKGLMWVIEKNLLYIKNDVGNIIGLYVIFYRDTSIYGKDAINTFFISDDNTGKTMGTGVDNIWHYTIKGNNIVSIQTPDIWYDINVCGVWYKKTITQHTIINF